MAPPRTAGAYRFAAGINEWYEKVASPTGGALQWVVEFVTDLLSEIVGRTPWRSGRARANWLVGIGAQPRGARKIFDIDGDQTVRNGALVLLSMRVLSPTIFIVNNLPYALRLERGSSDFAPYGMVALAIESVGQKYGLGGMGMGQYVGSLRENTVRDEHRARVAKDLPGDARELRRRRAAGEISESMYAYKRRNLVKYARRTFKPTHKRKR